MASSMASRTVARISMSVGSCCVFLASSLTGCFNYAKAPALKTQMEIANERISRGDRSGFCEDMVRAATGRDQSGNPPALRTDGEVFFHAGRCVEEGLGPISADDQPVFFYQRAAACGESRAVPELERLASPVPTPIGYREGVRLFAYSTSLSPAADECGFERSWTTGAAIVLAPFGIVLALPVALALVAGAFVYCMVSLPFGGCKGGIM